MAKRLFTSCFICIVIFNGFCHAQPVSDAGLWSTFSIEKEISKKINFSMDEEFRLRQNISMLNLFYTNVGVSYKAFKWMKFGFTYRLIEKWRYENQIFSYRHRLMFDLMLKYKLGNWGLSYRGRIQSEVRDIYSSEKGMIPEWYWRNKVDIKYKINQFAPYFGAEFRYQISDPRAADSNMGWHRVRTYAGCDYEINSKNTVGVYYLIQRDFEIADPEYLYIIGIQYSIVLNSSRKINRD